jgi:predicted ribosomally synthesized peptide with nif11-like leader
MRAAPVSSMSEEQLKAFLDALQGDTLLQERLKAAADADAVVALAKEAGFAISKAEVLKAQAQQTTELSDEELEEVAGGAIMSVCWFGRTVYPCRSGMCP